MKVLIITKHYLDQSLGGPNCSKAFIKALTSIYDDCTLIYPEHNDHTTQMPFMDCGKVVLVPCFDKRSRLRKGVDVYLGKIHRFGGFVKSFLSKNSFDIIFIDHSFTAASGVIEAAVKSGSKIVTLHHNVESTYIKDNGQSILFRLPYNRFSIKAEHKSIIHSDLNLTLTEADRKYFTDKYADKRDTFDVMGIFEYIDRSTDLSCTPGTQTFIISGALSAVQTETALMAFLNDYMPALNEICPQSKLIITGRNPSRNLIDACGRFENITITPNPENIFKEVAKGSYYICPLFTGSGIKLRVMDALVSGLPVVAHDVSVNGYESIVKDGFMFGYHDVESFKSAVKEVMTVKEHSKVRDSFLSYFSYTAGRNRLLSILKQHRMI